jgi:Domain of unknown function (DUF4440)
MSTISQRIKNSVTVNEHAVWRALSTSGAALLPFLADECIIIHRDGKILSSSTTPSIKKTFESDDYVPFLNYKIEDVEVVEVDMMAAIIVYKVTAERQGGEYQAIVSSTWRQNAGADWQMCAHQETSL